MATVLAMLYVLLHGLLLWRVPEQARVLSVLMATGAALAAALACAWRGRHAAEATAGWHALALAMLLWGGGMASHLPGLPGAQSVNPGLGVLLFVLYMVPLVFTLGWSSEAPPRVRMVDAALALLLAGLFAMRTSDFSSLHGTPDYAIAGLQRVFDLGNAFVLLLATMRWQTAQRPATRRLFGVMSLYAGAYLAVAFYINHFDTAADYGTASDLLIDLPLLALAVAATWPGPRVTAAGVRHRHLARVMQAASPLALPLAMLLVSASLVHTHLRLAIAGFTMAVVGYGVRMVMVQLEALARLDHLQALARIDPLTGLGNRRQFEETLQREWERSGRDGGGLALLVVDIDHFKAVNDQLGHQAGDQCLRTVASILEHGGHEVSATAARYGGEEFVLILPAAGEAALRVAERIRHRIEHTALCAGAWPGMITASIGVAVAGTPHAETAHRLFEQADSALYQAKHAGRNRVVLHGTGASPPPVPG